MKTRKIIATITLLLLFFCHGAAAQEPLQFNVIPMPPFSPTAGDYMDNPSRFVQVTLTNTSRSTQHFYLSIKLEMLMPGTALVEIPHNMPPLQPVSIGPFETMMLTQMHYDQLLGHLSFNDLHRKGIDEQSITGGTFNLLPEGLYQICFTALDFNAPFGQPRIISSQFGACANFNICYAAAAPILATPVNCNMQLPHDTIQPSNPFMIAWMPPAFNCTGAIANFNYSLKIVEVMPGQDLQSAIDFNPIALQLQNIMVATLPIDTNLYPGVFRRGQRYAMQVMAEEAFGGENILIENDGISPVCTFVWGSVPVPDEDTEEDPPPVEPEPEDPDEPIDPIIVIDDTSESSDPQCVAEVPQNTTPFEGTLDGQQVQIGLFTMHVTQASENNGMWTGTGKVDWNPQGNPLRVRVEFNNIRINTDLKVFEGAVFSQQETALHEYIPEIIQKQIDWAQTQYNVADELATQLGFNIPLEYNRKMEEYTTYIGETSKLIHNLTGDINLPINLESMIPGTDIDIGIIGMVFTPHVARMNTFSAFRVPEALPGMDNAQWLAFLGHGMCFTPNIVVSTNEANLFLAADFNINIGGGFRLTFKKSSTLGDMSDGTFISWNNEGFEEAMISFDVQLPSSIRGENPDGTPNDDRIAVSFEAWFSDWNDWIAEASVPPFQVRGLSEFSFAANRIVYDHSKKQNPDGIIFPPDPNTQEDYGAGGNEWRGFWLDQLQVMLPADFKSTDPGNPRPSITLNQLLIDNQGFTFDILALNPLQSGVLGGCAFSIDTIAVNMYKSDFRLAKINGGITIPVTDSPLPYEGILRWDDNDEMDYLFYVKPTNDISMPAWIASLNIYESSGLEVKKDEHGAAVSFLLHGDISLDSQYAIDIPLVFSFSGIGFQNMGIANRNPNNNEPEFYLSAGDWSQTSPQKSIGPFDVSIEPPSPYFEGSEFGLQIDAGFSIVGAFECNTSFNVLGKLDWNVAENMLPTGVGLESVRLDSVAVSGEFGPVNINGVLNFYYDDPTFGNGMRGEVSAIFEPAISLKAVAQFGRVDDYTYWYVDAMANFSPNLQLVTPLSLGGFGGGVYYNMARSVEPDIQFTHDENTGEEIPDLDDISLSPSGVVYVPQKNSWGFKAAITLTLQDANVFNGTLSISCEFKNNSFSNLRIDGDAYLVTNFPANDDYLANANVEFTYCRDSKEMGFTVHAQATFILGASVQILIKFWANTEEGRWYLKMGNPHGDRIVATLIDFKSSPFSAHLSANAYFAFGNSLPNPNLPLPPEEIVRFLGLSQVNQHRVSIENVDGKGMLFGAGVRGSLEVNLLIYLYLEAIAGFDVSLMHYDETCNGDQMGWNGWYGTGQVYAYLYGDAGININVWFYRGRVSLVNLQAGAFLMGGIPTPFWAYGKVRVRGSVLGGLIHISTSAEVKVGKECYPPAGDPLVNIEILEDIQPGFETFSESESNDPVSVFSIPRITTNVDLSDDAHLFDFLIEIPPSQDNPNGETRQYKFTIESVRLFTNVNGELPEDIDESGIDLPFSISGFQNRKQVIADVSSIGGFEPNTSYAMRVVARAWQRLHHGGSHQLQWQDPLIDGEPVENVEYKDTYFRTGELPNNIDDRVLASMPLHRQRYFFRTENFSVVSHGRLDYLWNDDESRIEAYITKQHDNPQNPSFPPHLLGEPHFSNINSVTYQNNVSHLMDGEEIYNFSILRINEQAELDFLAQMAEERRRLMIRSLITNNWGHVITHGQLDYDDLGDLIKPPTPDLGEASGFSPPQLDDHLTGLLDSGSITNIVSSMVTPSSFEQPLSQGDRFRSTDPVSSSLIHPEPVFPSPALPDQPTLSPGHGNFVFPELVDFDGPEGLLQVLTLEQYNEKYKADTLDFRQQVLLGQFEADYIDTLFTVTFATSRHSTLGHKVAAFGGITIDSYGIAYSNNAAEPFEAYDLFGSLADHLLHSDYPYMRRIPPLLNFYQMWNEAHVRDSHWYWQFNIRAHYIRHFCGGYPPVPNQNWRPRNDVAVVPYPQVLELCFGDSEVNRLIPLFSLYDHGFDFYKAEKLFPGRFRDAVFHGPGPNPDPFLQPDWLTNHELQNASANIVKTPQKLSFNHLVIRRQISDDLFAILDFTHKMRQLMVEFGVPGDNRGAARRSMTNNWIGPPVEWIYGSNSSNTSMWMPKYQIAWFFTLATDGNRPDIWEYLMEPVPNVSGDWFNHNTRLSLERLNIFESIKDQPWNYSDQRNIQIPVQENFPGF